MTNYIEYNNRWYSYGSCTNNETNNNEKKQPIIENNTDDYSPTTTTTTERRNNFLKAQQLPLFLLMMMIVCMMYLIILCQNILYELKNQQQHNNQVVVATTTAADASRSFVVSSSSSSQKKDIIMKKNTADGYYYTKNEKIPLLGKQRRQQQPPNTDDNKFDETTIITVLIVYIPNDEGQFIMSSRVADGVKSVLGDDDDEVKIMMESVTDATFEQVLQADAVILGSSVENGNTHPMLQSWINDHWNLSKSTILSQKVGGAFVTAGGMSAGEEGTLHSLIQTMLIFQMIIVGGNNWYSAFGASAVTAEEPFIPLEKAVDNKDDQEEILDFPRDCYETNNNVVIHPIFQQKAYGLGVRVATVVSRLRS